MTVVPEGRKLLRREVRNAETLAAGRSCLRHEGEADANVLDPRAQAPR